MTTFSTCPICLGRDIPPDGPTPCPIMFIGEGPARDEIRQHRNFAGRAGREYDLQYLPLAGLLRDDVYTTNACRSPRPGFNNPTHEEAAACSRFHLPRELRHCRPSLIIPMGGVACSLFDTPIDLEVEHGIPQVNSLLQGEWEGEVFPVYHPAAGLHEGQIMIRLRQDFSNLGKFLRGELTVVQDAHLNRHSRLLVTADEVFETGLILRDPPEVAIDTEGSWQDPWCLSFSFELDKGYAIQPSTPALEVFRDWLCNRNCLIGLVDCDKRPLAILHYYLHDAPVLRAMGIEVGRFFDTMQAAYTLGNLPQGLKALGYRLLGMRMRDYTDVVYPHSRPVAFDWLKGVDAQCRDLFTHQHTLKAGPRKGQQEERVLEGAPKGDVHTWRKVQALIRDHEKADPWKRWEGWTDGDVAFLTALAGGMMPRPSLSHVPLEEAVTYAGEDAMATFRLKPVLEGMCRRFRREYL